MTSSTLKSLQTQVSSLQAKGTPMKYIDLFEILIFLFHLFI